ncbi:unnamed protein product [Sympodiomycopsis kandeliae]
MLSAEELLQIPFQALDDDTYPTPTSYEESQVEEDIHETLSQYLSGGANEGLPAPSIQLQRKIHIKFLEKILHKPLPAAFVGFDATRPWLMYWSFHTYTLLGEPIDDVTRIRAVSTLLSCQNKSLGGFGGGPGQIPHLMATYAAINTLAIVGGPGPLPTRDEVQRVKTGAVELSTLGKGGWDDIDRQKLYAWIMRLKQPDGSFTVHEGGEVDVRASYCVWCIATLTGIVTPELLKGVSGFLASCQSYEGGLSSTSYPTYNPADLSLDSSVPRPALGEAHGGYAFCAAAAYLGVQLLDPKLFSSSQISVGLNEGESRIDLSTLTRWTLGLQCPFPSQGGGFKGRINKLVDGCYSWFSGAGMWGVLESLLQLEKEAVSSPTSTSDDQSATTPIVPELWSREGLQLYILLVAQNLETGGLRDKPGKKSDAYHTCYNLSGLSASQHIARPCAATRKFCYEGWKSSQSSDQDAQEELGRRIYSSMLGFNLAPGRSKKIVGEKTNEILPTHPVYNVGFLQVRDMLQWAYKQT